MDIDANVRAYLDGGTTADGRTPNARYSSFDYCFNYLQAFRDTGNTAALANPGASSRAVSSLASTWPAGACFAVPPTFCRGVRGT